MHGDCQMFYGSKIIENAQRLLIVFWIRNARKCLVATRHFLDRKCQKTFDDRQAFPLGLEMLQNTSQLPNIFWIENAQKFLAIAKHFLDQQFQKCLMAIMCFLGWKSQKMFSGHQAFFRLEIIKKVWQLTNTFWIKEKRESQRKASSCQEFFQYPIEDKHKKRLETTM